MEKQCLYFLIMDRAPWFLSVLSINNQRRAIHAPVCVWRHFHCTGWEGKQEPSQQPLHFSSYSGRGQGSTVFRILTFDSSCTYMCTSVGCVHMSVSVQRGIPWGWSYRWLWSALRWCWESSSVSSRLLSHPSSPFLLCLLLRCQNLILRLYLSRTVRVHRVYSHVHTWAWTCVYLPTVLNIFYI